MFSDPRVSSLRGRMKLCGRPPTLTHQHKRAWTSVSVFTQDANNNLTLMTETPPNQTKTTKPDYNSEDNGNKNCCFLNVHTVPFSTECVYQVSFLSVSTSTKLSSVLNVFLPLI